MRSHKPEAGNLQNSTGAALSLSVWCRTDPFQRRYGPFSAFRCFFVASVLENCEPEMIQCRAMGAPDLQLMDRKRDRDEW